MVENQHRKITGYRDLSEAEIVLMNEAKQHESAAAALVARVREVIDASGAQPQALRDIAMARTSYEDATIRLVRAIALPRTP
jgi:type IV pilus biogenesis protein CpaD/CtpE